MSGYKSLGDRERAGLTEDHECVRLGMIDDEPHGAEVDYARAHAERDTAAGVAQHPVAADKENVDLNVSIMGPLAGQHDREQTKSSKLSRNQPLASMEVKLAAEAARKPTQVGRRRALVVVLLAAFAGVLVAIVASEGRALGEDDILVDSAAASVQVADPAGGAPSTVVRKDVFLLRFRHASDGRAVRWNETDIVGGEAMARATAHALERVPFGDFSLELRRPTAHEAPAVPAAVELACVQTQTSPDAPRVAVEDASAVLDCSPKLRVVASLPGVDMCVSQHASALKNAAECDETYQGDSAAEEAAPAEDAPAEDAAAGQQGSKLPGIVGLLQQSFRAAAASPGSALSSRCCDTDAALDEKATRATLQMCLMPLDAGPKKFLEYYGREALVSCAAPVCGCTCFADRSFVAHGGGGGLFGGAKEGCPSVAGGKLGGQSADSPCKAVAKVASHSCKALPAVADDFLSSNGVHLGDGARCYGDKMLQDR